MQIKILIIFLKKTSIIQIQSFCRKTKTNKKLVFPLKLPAYLKFNGKTKIPEPIKLVITL